MHINYVLNLKVRFFGSLSFLLYSFSQESQANLGSHCLRAQASDFDLRRRF